MRILGSSVRTCLGDGPETFAALLAGRDGCGPLRGRDPVRLRVANGYHVGAAPFAPSRWLADCVRRAVRDSGIDPAGQRVACLVGTGLRELATVEDSADPRDVPVHRLHFADAVRAVLPTITEVVTIANACSASGHALALAEDMLMLGDADVAVVAGTDAMTTSMLAMIGRVTPEPTDRVRPFDAARQGVLLGEGAAAVVVVPGDRGPRLLATGLSCDAHHETAPSVEGITRAMRDAYARAGCTPGDVRLVVAHGTGTALNDPAECAAMTEVFRGVAPLVTAVKGAVGHMSGTAALLNVDVALRCLAAGRVPPVVGLRDPVPEANGLDLVRGRPRDLRPGLAQVNAFGFGGVNSVTLLAAS